MPTLLITGANRGLGLELVRQYGARDDHRIVACCRRPDAAPELAALASERVSVHALEVTDPAQIGALVTATAGAPLDVLVNNAGVYGDRLGSGSGLGSIDYDAWATTFAVNAMSPLRMVEAFLPQLRAGQARKIVNITSRMGSIADNTSGGSYLYRSSKAALNMVNRSLSLDLAAEGFTCIVMHPGWVATDMGTAAAPLSAAESVAGMIAVIDRITTADNGAFINHDDTPIPW